MNMKEHILTALMELFTRWETMLTGLSEQRLLLPLAPSQLTPKDVVAHMRAWQQRSIARMEAAREGREPEFPQWIPELDADADGNTDLTNAWIYDTYKDQLWAKVRKDWREGFLYFMDLGEAVSERDLLDGSKYPWLAGQPLALILLSSYDHHQEHYEKLSEWLKEHADK